MDADEEATRFLNEARHAAAQWVWTSTNLGAWAAKRTSAANRPRRSIFYRLFAPQRSYRAANLATYDAKR